MSRPTKLVIAALTLAPIVLMLVMVVLLLAHLPAFFESGGSVSPQILQDLGELFYLPIAASILGVGLLIFYAGHLLVTRAAAPTSEKALWLLLLLCVPMIGMPIYWFMHIWTEQPVRDELARHGRR